ERDLANTGHIPGARCLPYQELVDGATGLWAAPASVARLARDAGIDPDSPPQELIATCGSGVSATVALFSLEHLVCVFIPAAPTPFSGFVVYVPREDLVPLPVSVDEAMRIIISA